MPKTGGEYNEGVVGNPITANPLLATTEADLDIAFLTHRGLFTTDDQGKIITDLAESYELSEDKKTYLVKLHPDLRWSDGAPITAADVVFTFESAKQEKLRSPLAASFRDITVTASSDGLTTSFTLKEPYVPFLYALTVGIIPAHIWQKIPYENWLNAEVNLKPVGTGPFRFKALTRDGLGNIYNYTLESNPYFEAATPYFNKFNLRFYPDMTTALDALRQGLIDGLGDLSNQDKNSLNQNRFIVYNITLPQYTAIFYNPNTNNVLKEAAVRQGLSYAINRADLIRQALNGQAQPATSPFTFGEFKSRTNTQAITYDPTKTTQLFTLAGYTKPEGSNIFSKDEQKLEITLTVVDTNEQLRVAEVIKQQWEAVGVMVTIQSVSAATFQSTVITPRNYQALLASEVVGLDPDPYPFWHSSQVAAPGLNLSQWQNREADQLLIEARQDFNEASRLEKYVTWQNTLQQESPATFLYSLNYNYAQSYSIKGFSRSIISQPTERLLNAVNWYRRTTRSAIE